MHPITALQTEYSLFTRDLEDEILGVLRELGIGLVPYSPLGRGLLTGAITRDSGADGERDNRRSSYFPRFQGEALDANLALVDKITRDRRRRRAARPASWPSPGCSPRATTSPRSPAPSG